MLLSVRDRHPHCEFELVISAYLDACIDADRMHQLRGQRGPLAFADVLSGRTVSRGASSAR